jgi:alkylation response protein AidB-like acyl-CoA dehydrogenase
MAAPGVTVRPIITMGGAHEFNEVYLDDVTVEHGQILGSLGGGWTVAMSGLEAERFGVGGNVAMLELLLDDVVDCARSIGVPTAPPLSRPAVQDRLAQLAGEVEAATAVVSAHIERSAQARPDDVDAATGKILYSETYGRLAGFGVDLILADGCPEDLDRLPSAQRLYDAWLWSRALTISGGSSEIMRNVIARRGLRLPDGRSSTA